jgi:xylulokinase
VAEVTEATSWGAAILGGLGAGVYPDVTSALDTIRSSRRTVEPVADQVAFYEAYYRQVYQKIYEALRPLHHEIYRLQHDS